MKYFKKISLVLSFITILFLSSCTNANTTTSDITMRKYTNTTITKFYDKMCSFNDTGRLNDIAYFDNGYVEGEKRSVPIFDYWYIDKKSTNSKIPSFIMAGDRITFSNQESAEVAIDDPSKIKTHPIGHVFSSIRFNNDSDLEYYRAEVKEIEESKIHRDENGYVTGIDYYGYDVTQHITIDKEYYYINLNEYKGEKIYVSGSGGNVRLYSFNPLEE